MSQGRTGEGRPLIIGHRGASAHAPENTHAAFGMAFEQGADGVEFDVRLASDGVPVVIHDATCDRTLGVRGEVASRPSEFISKAGAGEWFNRRYPLRAFEGFARERAPTLEQVYERYGRGLLYVELKCEDASRRLELARAVVELTRARGVAERVVVKCFELDALAEVKRLAPELRTAALFERGWPRPPAPVSRIIAAAEACGADEISLHRSLARPGAVEQARRRGFEVLAWTVNSPVWLRRARGLGLRCVFTDTPRRMVRALGGESAPSVTPAAEG